MNELGYDESMDQLSSIVLQASGFQSIKGIYKEMRRDLTYLMNKNRDLLDLIDIAKADLERLLEDYRIFEEFPITMGDGTGGSVVVQDPMMESTRKYVERRINNIILKEGEGRGMITADNLPDNVGIEMHTRSSRTRGTTVSFKYATFDKESGEVISGHGSSFLPGPNGLYGIVAIKKLPPERIVTGKPLYLLF